MESLHQPINSKNSDRDYEYAPIVVVTGAEVEPQPRMPGPSILKSSKNGKNTSSKQKITPDCSPSKQPLIGPELRNNDSIGSALGETTVLPATKVTATIVLPISTSSNSKNIVAGGYSSGRERTLSTFGDKSKNPYDAKRNIVN